MFRILRLSSRFLRKAGIPSTGPRVKQLLLNFHGMYRRDMRELESKAFDASGDLTDQSDDESEADDEKIFNRRCAIAKSMEKIIRSYEKEIDWEEVINKSLVLPNPRRVTREVVKGYIVYICTFGQMFEALTSYFKYLVKNKELCAGMLYLICGTISRYPKELEECTGIVYEIYLKLQPEQRMPLQSCSMALLASDRYRSLMVDNLKTDNTGGAGELIKISINSNDMDTAFNYLHLCKSDIAYNYLSDFLKYFQSCAERGEKPVSRFVQFFDLLCKIEGNKPITGETLDQIKQLMSKLNSYDKTHKWSFKMTSVDDVCKVCSGKLQKYDITDDEVQTLKENVKKNVIFGKNINVRSTSDEWKQFIAYLNKKPYDIAIDGLNVIYQFVKNPGLLAAVAKEGGETNKTRDFFRKKKVKCNSDRENIKNFGNLLRNLDKMELTPLILGRKHFGRTSEYTLINKKYPVFLTQDLSDDDVFVLYAALNMGKNCYILTNDQMGFTKTCLASSELQDIFIRWQALHQCFIFGDNLVLPHGLPLGLQKTSSGGEDEFRYHLVTRFNSYRKVYCISRLKRK